MKHIIALLFFATAAQAEIRVVPPNDGDLADAVSTYAALATGNGLEGNPLLAGCGGALETALCALVAKVAVKSALVSLGMDEWAVDSAYRHVGWAAAGNNAVVGAMGAGHVAAQGVGAGVGWVIARDIEFHRHGGVHTGRDEWLAAREYDGR